MSNHQQFNVCGVWTQTMQNVSYRMVQRRITDVHSKANEWPAQSTIRIKMKIKTKKAN